METKQGYFDPKMPRALDDRFYKATQAEILAIPEGARYIGMEIYAYTDQVWYQFKDGVGDGDLIESPERSELHDYAEVRYIDNVNGSDSNDGQYNTPYQSLTAVLTERLSAPSSDFAIYILSGGDQGPINYDGTGVTGRTWVYGIGSAGILAATWIQDLTVTNSGSKFYLVNCPFVNVTMSQTGTNSTGLRVRGGQPFGNISEGSIDAYNYCFISFYAVQYISLDTTLNIPVSLYDGSVFYFNNTATAADVRVLGGTLRVRDGRTLTLNYAGIMGTYDDSNIYVAGTLDAPNITELNNVNVILADTGTFNLNPACVVNGAASKYHNFDPTGSSLSSENVEDAIKETSTLSGGHVIEDEGTPLAQQDTLNFVGDGVTAADSGGKTVVTIPGGVGGGPELNKWYVNKNGNDTTGDGSPQNPYLTIQKAINEAVAEDEIYLSTGVFAEATITIDKTLTFIGVGGESDESSFSSIQVTNLVIDATAAARVVRFESCNIYATGSITRSGANLARLYTNSCVIGVDGTITLPYLITGLTTLYGSIVVDNVSLFDSLHASGTISNGSIVVALTNSTATNINITGNLDQTNSVIKGTISVGGTHTIYNQDGGGGGEVTQTLTVTDANYTDALALDADTNIVEITLDAALTNDWQPSGITGWVVGRSYTWMIVKASDNGVDLTTARAVPNVGYDDDIDPFAALVDIDTTQQRAVISATGFKSTFGQFGRLIITDSGYVE